MKHGRNWKWKNFDASADQFDLGRAVATPTYKTETDVTPFVTTSAAGKAAASSSMSLPASHADLYDADSSAGSVNAALAAITKAVGQAQLGAHAHTKSWKKGAPKDKGAADDFDASADQFDLGRGAATPPDTGADVTSLAATAKAAPAPGASLAAPLAATAQADFYVAVNGKDTNSGSINSPLATITKAVALAQAGDVISVRGGTYNGAQAQAKIWKSGAKDKPIVIQEHPGERAILDGTGTKSGTDLVAITGSYITFQGFEVRDATRSGISVYAAHDVKVIGNEVYDTHRGGIWVGAGKEGQSYNNLIQNNIIHDTVMENSAKTWKGGWARALAIDVTKNSVVKDNYVYDNYGEGIGGLSSSNVSYTNNKVYDNYSVQMYFDNSQYIKVTGNKVFHTGDRDFYRGGKPGIGILVANEYTQFQKASKGYEITNNTLAGVGAPKYDGGYGWGGGLSDSKLTPNTVVSQYDADWLHIA